MTHPLQKEPVRKSPPAGDPGVKVHPGGSFSCQNARRLVFLAASFSATVIEQVGNQKAQERRTKKTVYAINYL